MPEDNDERWYKELDAANVGDYTVLLYETWIGSREDPATTVEEWMSMFVEEELPDEYSTAVVVGNGTAPYTADSRYSYRHAFSGLKGAMVDEKLRVVQEGDESARKHRNASEQLLNQNGSSSAWRVDESQVYEGFLAAIERVAENEEDEEAWEVIDRWRTRKLRAEERDV